MTAGQTAEGDTILVTAATLALAAHEPPPAEAAPAAAPAEAAPAGVADSDLAMQESLMQEGRAPADAAPGLAWTRRLSRRGFFSDMPDKGLFALFSAVGFGAILAAKLYGAGGLGVAAGSVGMLIGYAAVSYRIEFFRLHPDRLGDNCYYMGFLFTLSSLSAALLAVEGGGSGPRGALIEALIGSFGVALFSTIGGIALRVLFMQMRREVEDLEEQVRNDLQIAAGLLRDQLGMAVIDLETFRIRTTQVLGERLDEATAGLARGAEAMVAHIAGLSEAQTRASTEFAAETTRLVSERVVAELARLAERIERIEVPADLITRQVEAARERIETLAGMLEQHVQTDARLIATQVDTARQRILSLGEALEQRIEADDRLIAGQVDAARQRILSLGEVLERHAQADAGRQAALTEVLAQLEAAMRRLADTSAFERVGASTDRLTASLAATAEKVSALQTQLGAQGMALGRFVAQAEEDSVTMTRVRGQMRADQAEAAEALRQLQATLVDVARGIASRLE